MKLRLMLLVGVAAILMAVFWYRQASGQPARKHRPQDCTDEQGLLYSEGAALKARDGLKRCVGGTWVPYAERR